MFSQFRFKLIAFLKLPFDISEPALRKVLERNCGVYANYLARAKRVDEILKSEDTLEMTARDHRRSDSPNRKATLPVSDSAQAEQSQLLAS